MFDGKITIIGAGHIGQAIARGLIFGKAIKGQNITLANPHLEKLYELQKKYHVKLTTNNINAVKSKDIIVIAVRPKIVTTVIKEIKPYINKDQIIISLAVGVTLKLLEFYLNQQRFKIIRINPSIPISYNKGVLGWFGNSEIKKEDEVLLRKLLSPLGLLIKCKKDDDLEKLSMIAGSGTGYVTYFMKHLREIAKEYGFRNEESYKIVLYTFLGIGYHIQKRGFEFEDILSSIATKGGITEEVVKSMDEFDFHNIFRKSIDRGYDKIKNIQKELEELK